MCMCMRLGRFTKWGPPSTTYSCCASQIESKAQRDHAFLAWYSLWRWFGARTSATAAGFSRSLLLSSSRSGQAVTVHHNTYFNRLSHYPPASRAASVLGHLSSLRPHWKILPCNWAVGKYCVGHDMTTCSGDPCEGHNLNRSTMLALHQTWKEMFHSYKVS